MARSIQRSSLHERLRARALRILQPTFGYFLRLPTEIRLQIYDIVLADAIDKKSPQPLALLRVSKQLFIEYREFALSHIRPTFNRTCDVYTYWRIINPSLRHRVKHIKIVWTTREDLSEICSIVELPWFHLRTLTIGIQARRSDKIVTLLEDLCFQLRSVVSVDLVRIVPSDTSGVNWFNPWHHGTTKDDAFLIISNLAKRNWVRQRKDTLQCCKWLRGVEVGQRYLGLQTLAYTLTRRAALNDVAEVSGPATKADSLEFERNMMLWLRDPGWWLVWYPSPGQVQFDVRVYE